MKRVLILIDSLAGGGAERALFNLVQQIDQSKYCVTVMTIYDIGIYKTEIKKYVKYDTLNFKKIKGLNYILQFISNTYLHKIFIKNEYDIEIAFLEGLSSKIVSGAPKNVKKAAWVRIDVSQYKRHEVPYISKSELLKSYKQFDKIAFVGEDALNSFKKCYGDFNNLEVIRNIYYNEDMIEKSNEECNLFNYKAPIFLCVGRLEIQKGYERLVEVHSKLINDGYMHTILVLGQGSLEQKLKDYVKEKNCEDTFIFLGYQSNPFKYMKNVDWLLMPSLYEGFSSVIRESILLGTPIIATDCSGVREILGNDEFGIVMNNSTNGIYNGLKNVLSDNALHNYYKNKVIERQSFFDFEKTVKQNLDFLERM